jgi:hypothetical protein
LMRSLPLSRRVDTPLLTLLLKLKLMLLKLMLMLKLVLRCATCPKFELRVRPPGLSQSQIP